MGRGVYIWQNLYFRGLIFEFLLYVCRISINHCIFYKFYLTDKEPPKLLRCPDDIVKFTSSNQPEWIDWPEPIYTDNCGDYPVCRLSVTNNYNHNPVRVPVGAKYNIEYTAIDPSGNANKECSFSIYLKGKSNLTFLLVNDLTFTYLATII